MNKTKKMGNSSIKNKSTNKNNLMIDNYNKFVLQRPNSLPKTEIIKNMNNTYQTYIDEKKQNIEKSKLEDFFIIPDNLKTKLNSDDNALSLNITLNNNPDMNLDNLICYLTFNFPNMFKTGSINMEEFKYQVGKDYHRINVIINNKPLPEEVCPKSGIETSQYNKIVDNLNNYIMDVMNQNNVAIKFNTIIKINALLMQSVFNTMVNLFVAILLSKEIIIKNGVKNVNIVLKPSHQYMVFSYNAPLINFNTLCECGTFSFNLKTNFLTNSFLMDVKLSYDTTKCLDNLESPNKESASDKDKDVLDKDKDASDTDKTNKLDQYGKSAYNFVNNNKSEIAAAVTTTGLATVGALLFAGLLGGKPNSKMKTRSKRSNYKQNASKKVYKNDTRKIKK